MGSKSNKDLESGKGKENSKTSSNFGKLAAMFFAAAVLAGASAAAYVYFGWQLSLMVAASLLVLIVIVFNYRWIYVAAVTAPRDIKALYHYARMNMLTRKLQKNNWAMADIFHQAVVRHPNKPCFLFESESWTFKEVEDHSLRVSAALKAAGLKPGGVVGLMLPNCPDYPAIWIGANRINCITALINTNQSGTALLHSINVAKCDVVIYGAEYEKVIQEVKKEINSSAKLFQYSRRPLNNNQTIKVADNENDFISMMESVPTPSWCPAEGSGFNGKLLYIYTSGTTGLPKAAIISSSRMVFMASGVHYLGGLSPKDVIYCPMPLYHSAGGCITMGQAVVFGCTVALRAKFSASNYFPDCIKFKATAAHYIGEMCRYVLSAPPAPTDKQHTVRTMYGNGMRPAIWRDFVTRFNIKKVAEFYGATEGNANIVNVDNKEGSVGFVSRIVPSVYPITLIKVDDVTGEPIRNKKGLCQLAKANEPGAFIGKINQANPARAYLGYVDKQASEKKVIKDVLTHGDSAFISGDILVADDFGYLYFKDRTGDTFRWRGENVSTSEVEAIVSRCAEQRDAVVYGVEIPNTEGRAGMCGIVDKEGTLIIDDLLQRISKDLPAYARPVFIRVMAAMEMTGTFKMRKVDLQKEGYDPTKIIDKLHYLDPKEKKYIPLDAEIYEKIMSGAVRL